VKKHGDISPRLAWIRNAVPKEHRGALCLTASDQLLENKQKYPIGDQHAQANIADIGAMCIASRVRREEKSLT
jgi:hypothetical protein